MASVEVFLLCSCILCQSFHKLFVVSWEVKERVLESSWPASIFALLFDCLNSTTERPACKQALEYLRNVPIIEGTQLGSDEEFWIGGSWRKEEFKIVANKINEGYNQIFSARRPWGELATKSLGWIGFLKGVQVTNAPNFNLLLTLLLHRLQCMTNLMNSTSLMDIRVLGFNSDMKIS